MCLELMVFMSEAFVIGDGVIQDNFLHSACGKIITMLFNPCARGGAGIRIPASGHRALQPPRLD